MNSQWTIAALLSSALIVGCSNQNAQNPEGNQDQALATPPTSDQVNPATPAAPAPSTSASVDNSAPRADRNDTTGARSTTGSRRAAPAPAPPIARDVAPAPAPAPPSPPRPQFREVTVP